MKYQQRYNEQNNIIERLLTKLQDHGIEVNEEDLVEERIDEQEMAEEVDQIDDEQVDAQLGDERPSMDLVVTFGSQNVAGSAHSLIGQTQELADTNYQTFEELKEQLRTVFKIPEPEDFVVKFVNDDGSSMELQEDTWQEVRAAQQ